MLSASSRASNTRRRHQFYQWDPPFKVETSKKTTESFSQASSTSVGDQEMRPEGIKAAKAIRNNGKGKGFEEYKSMCELKMDDLAMKEKLCKLSILDTLLAKKESLSESEEIVKNKLLAKYF
ncbi:hypothetical protein DY000_02062645 [Brassica cretica]|uniref:Uncharacterized protein n=1 Tax=Brassica cretica TaxID=69181 RepID=A0ABQ7B430_BRACR|nr:hypothetical protein DY000_02062645 [Brassica cretica]